MMASTEMRREHFVPSSDTLASGCHTIQRMVIAHSPQTTSTALPAQRAFRLAPRTCSRTVITARIQKQSVWTAPATIREVGANSQVTVPCPSLSSCAALADSACGDPQTFMATHARAIEVTIAVTSIAPIVGQEPTAKAKAHSALTTASAVHLTTPTYAITSSPPAAAAAGRCCRGLRPCFGTPAVVEGPLPQSAR